MKRLRLLAITLTILALLPAVFGGIAIAEDLGNQTITDMAGREVIIPKTIETLCATGQPGAVLLYTLCPEKLVA